jgi:1,4-alpha-glucan branching enzyme
MTKADEALAGLDALTIDAILRGACGDPFSILGMHRRGEALAVCIFAPQAEAVTVVDVQSDTAVARLDQIHPEGLFAGMVRGRAAPFPYLLEMSASERVWREHDPYRFGPTLGELDRHLLGEGRHRKLYEVLGAHPVEFDGVEGTRFAVWAPNAQRVSVVGDFNGWDGRRHPMRRNHGVGVWDIFIPGLARGARYQYEIIGSGGTLLPLKADPVSFHQEPAPSTCSMVRGLTDHGWADRPWIDERHDRQSLAAPISIYEVHMGSWRRGQDNTMLGYDDVADQLIPYVCDLGFTHIELLPIGEHPFAGSWGYQPIGIYAPTSRFGPPEAFARFVDRCHQAGIGVIIDWVPAHFPSDSHGLARFDGTALYEHEDPRLGFHKDWNTLIYNFGRYEISNYLTANALFWLDRYHVDALRVDAVASMLYLDYSRAAGEWIPNKFGGNENLEAIEFLRQTNTEVFGGFPGTTTIAEESTAWPQVSRPVYTGGLGFGYKWNMGWMHDTLDFMSKDPIYRRHHHHQMTFGIHYAFTENFVLPLSHDEVVHGKRSILGRMPGDRWQRFANLRAYYAFMWMHPGKKLLFMGGEFGQEREWNHDQSLDWHLLEDPMHEGIRSLIRDLNRLYREVPNLHEGDCSADGFEWIDASDAENSVLAFLRYGSDRREPVTVICNFTPMVRERYRVGVPLGGLWTEVLNTDSRFYGGSDVGNQSRVDAIDRPQHGRPASLELTLPPLATLVLRRQSK